MPITDRNTDLPSQAHGVRRVVGSVIAISAVLLMLVTLFLTISNVVLQLTSLKTTGEVVALETVRGSDGQVRVPVQYQTVIEFPDNNGQFRRFIDVASTGSPPAIGEDVGVLFNPQNPAEARWADYSLIWRGAVAFGVAALVFGIVAEELLRRRHTFDRDDLPPGDLGEWSPPDQDGRAG